jgi:adenylate kinase
MKNRISNSMNIVLLGPPGAGKGTQADRICSTYNIPRISSGDLLRREGAQETPSGREARTFMAKGLLVPDHIVIDVVRNHLTSEICKTGFLLDGFPRNIVQAENLEKFCPIELVLYLDLGIETALDRLEGRRSCLNCGAVYHLKFNPPGNEGLCDKCGKKLTQREDDMRATIVVRFETYEKETLPLISYYDSKNLLRRADSEGSIDETFGHLRGFLDALEKL